MSRRMDRREFVLTGAAATGLSALAADTTFGQAPTMMTPKRLTAYGHTGPGFGPTDVRGLQSYGSGSSPSGQASDKLPQPCLHVGQL